MDSLSFYEAAFRSAVEEGDFAETEVALDNYVARFQSGPSTLADIECARNMLKWGVQVTRDRKADMLKQFVSLTRISQAYLPRSLPHTWKLDG